jgi:hypothetical protein
MRDENYSTNALRDMLAENKTNKIKHMDINNKTRSIAYCLGFVHGYEVGVAIDPYQDYEGDDQLKSSQLYKEGYEAGVTEYVSSEDGPDLGDLNQ